jgi:hypothetical protein
LKDIDGKFILSYNDDSMVRGLYRDSKITKKDPVHYSMNNREGEEEERVVYNELLNIVHPNKDIYSL